ncbi:uncharacterized protein J5F26_003445 [Ciconia maguari]
MNPSSLQTCKHSYDLMVVLCFTETYAVIHPEEKGKAAEKEGKFGPYGRVICISELIFRQLRFQNLQKKETNECSLQECTEILRGLQCKSNMGSLPAQKTGRMDDEEMLLFHSSLKVGWI